MTTVTGASGQRRVDSGGHQTSGIFHRRASGNRGHCSGGHWWRSLVAASGSAGRSVGAGCGLGAQSVVLGFSASCS